MSVLTILIADDEPDIRQLLEQWLQPLGHTILTAGNGTESLKLIERLRVDVVVTDVLMPDGDGLMLIDGLKKTQPTARVLAISGGGRYMNSEEYLKIAQGFGAHAALMKPFTREQFFEALHGVTAKREKAPA